ncbi:ABC transporter permease [candidate division WOR-3 bacterium]|nr:ABC transporter permease [candidate division WOR-3 bacterium]
MKKVFVLAEVTFKVLLRERSLYFISVFPVLMSLMPVLIKPLVLGEYEKILYDFSNATFLLTGILVAVVTGTTVIQTEFKQRTIYLILSKPVRRDHYLIAKFLGMYWSIFILEIFIALLFAVVFIMTKVPLRLEFCLNFIFIQLQLLIVCALSVFFSSFATPITGAVFTFLTVLSGFYLSSALNFSDISHKLNPLTKFVVSLLAYILPAFSEIDINILAYKRIPLGYDFALSAVSYSLFYVISCLALSIIFFERKEFF